MNITIFGTGYVGLVTGTCFAEMGNNVLCVDVDTQKVDALNQGQIPIFEPGLENLVRDNHARGRLGFTVDAERAVKHGNIIFIAVGTPSGEDGSADLVFVLQVAKTIASLMDEPKIIINKSTVPVGTADKVKQALTAELRSRGEEINFEVASNPEFLKEGAAISDFMKPDRIIIGSDSSKAARVLEQLYAPFNRNHDKVVHMDIRSAELTKYAANVMLASRISLMNELSNLADLLGADIESVRRGIGADPRIGFNFIYPGAGYGGSCFPKDVKALIRIGEDNGYVTHLVESIERVNNFQKTVLFSKILKHYSDKLEGKTFALWGIAFKPNTDDIREAPSLVIMEALWAAGAKVRAYDPQAMAETSRHYAGEERLTLCASRDEAIQGADALIVITEWNEFKAPDFEQLADILTTPVIFDGRNLYDPKMLKTLGFDYYCIGRNQNL